jgi:hypothetical protein
MITGYVGKGGAGKTFWAVRDLIATKKRKKGMEIYANTPLIDYRVRLARSGPAFDKMSGLAIHYPAWLPVDDDNFGLSWADGYVTTMAQVFELRNCVVLLDEVYNWMSSPKPGMAKNKGEEWTNLTMEALNWLNQDRKDGVDIIWSARRAMDVLNNMRENTAHLWRCQLWFKGWGGSWGWSIATEQDDDLKAKERPARKVLRLSPDIAHRYDTLAHVGDAMGGGYRRGGRDNYGQLTRGQRQVVLRRFGPDALDLVREEGAIAGVPWVRWRYQQDLPGAGLRVA